MFASPNSLQDACLDVICDNLFNYIEPHLEQQQHDKNEEKLDDSSSSEEEFIKFKFKDPDIFLINEISEKLLEKMCKKRLLYDSTFNIFTGKNTKLRKLTLSKCKLTKNGLDVIKEHNITHLECAGINEFSIGDILDALNERSLENIVIANFSKCTFINESRYSFMVDIAKLKNVRHLNLAYTELNQTMFKILCEDLIHLEKLDVSGTQVTDLRPLTMLSSTLVSLFLCDLHYVEDLIPTIEQLQRLQYLDISFFKEKASSRVDYHYYNPVLDLLESKHVLPNLIGLDISGWKRFVTKNSLMNFIELHPKLQFLGIVLCSVTFDPDFLDSIDKIPNLVIAGLGNERQIVVTLKKYKERSIYVQKALYHLFQLTSAFQEPRPDIFKLVQDVMEIHKNKFDVQMAATACVYNLTKGELSKSVHPDVLSKGVSLTLEAMERFPKEFQLQKNSLLSLCSDRILQEITFDRYKCAELVLNALCQFNDVNMERMAVAICSILAAKISTEETSKLGARTRFMQKLLTMVQSRLDLKTIDITLKFTLSALWNLTDESAETCKVFLENGGAQLFLDVLKIFKGSLAIEAKVLGLLNNIAEVRDLRESLMLEDLIEELNLLLKCENIEASYFAAGIIAHLACDGDEKWLVKGHSRNDMLVKLEKAVSQWQVPESEMVAYRSFKPFLPLLSEDRDYQVQFWAVWAIHHVCTKNPKRYCQMLQEEKVHHLLRELMDNSPERQQINDLCNKILVALNGS